MSSQQASHQAQSGKGAAAGPGGTPSLPDVNVETYPYEMVQYLLDQTANFDLFAVPNAAYAETATLTPNDPDDFFGLNGGYGVAINSTLHRFESTAQTPTVEGGVKVVQAVGESAGAIRFRCMFSPDDFQWAPGKLPPPVIYDPWKSQRFVMLDCEFDFGGANNFKGYGIGRTFPVVVNGRPRLLAGGVGNVMEGSGQFHGLEGTFIFTGSITHELGFLGNITLRIVDPEGRICTDREVSSCTAMVDPARGDTFVVLRGVKKDKSVRTTYGPPPGGNLVSLITPSQMRSAQFNFTDRGGGGMRTNMRVGQVIGHMEATVFFDLLAPPGTSQHPVPFTTQELYTFTDSDGRTVGTLTAGVVEGISFGLKFPAAPGQPGVRFAGFGPITGGTGSLEGAQGLLTVNSLIGIAPHTLSLMHVLHLVDPVSRHRA